MSTTAESQNLRKVGLKATTARIRILQLLEHNPDQHLSAEDVYLKTELWGGFAQLGINYHLLKKIEIFSNLKYSMCKGGVADIDGTVITTFSTINFSCGLYF